MAHRVLAAANAYWRPSNQMGVLNTDLGKQLDARTLGAALASVSGTGLHSPPSSRTGRAYVLLEGIGRMRVGEEGDARTPLRGVGRA